MKKQKQLGIWMDHAAANLIDLNSKKNYQTITSKFTFEAKEEVLVRSENMMHNKRQQLQLAYYNEIAAEILKCDHVLLFGSTNAKTELHNYLNRDLQFKDIKICVEPADKMTDNQKDAFVKEYFDEELGD